MLGVDIGLKKWRLSNAMLEGGGRVRPIIPLDTRSGYWINPLRPNSDLSQTSHCNVKVLSVSVCHEN